MVITTHKTAKVKIGDSLFHILNSFLPKLQEKDIVVITSKIVSICQERVVKNDGSTDKQALIIREADYFISPSKDSQFDVTLTIKNGMLIANSGIDESNGRGWFILWPEDPFEEAQKIWTYLKKRHTLRHLGIIITDSRTIPLRWGTIGVAIAWCGFEPLKNYIGKPDIFGRKLRMTKASILDGLSAAAVTAMGEGNEQTPLALIRGVPFVSFHNRQPTKREIEALTIDPSDDIYAPLLTSVEWKKVTHQR